MVVYADLLRDFASRTMTNLKFIEEAAHQGGLFEVTQLVNSFLGLFVFAQQSGQMPKRLYLGGTSLSGGDYGHFRNAISHFHIKQITQGGEICGLVLWDQWPDENHRNWQRKFTIDELRTIVDQMYAHLMDQ